jgi:tRNA-binding protein
VTDPIAYDDFLRVDVRVGTIRRAEPYPEARKPASSSGSTSATGSASAAPPPRSPPTTTRDAGGAAGPRRGQLPARQIGRFVSEVLVLGLPDADGHVVLVGPDQDVPVGGRLH